MARKKVTKTAASAGSEIQTIKEQAAIAENADLSPTVSLQERIALLAYTYWEKRGCQGGSPEEDWYRAEREIRSQPGSVES